MQRFREYMVPLLLAYFGVMLLVAPYFMRPLLAPELLVNAGLLFCIGAMLLVLFSRLERRLDVSRQQRDYHLKLGVSDAGVTEAFDIAEVLERLEEPVRQIVASRDDLSVLLRLVLRHRARPSERLEILICDTTPGDTEATTVDGMPVRYFLREIGPHAQVRATPTKTAHAVVVTDHRFVLFVPLTRYQGVYAYFVMVQWGAAGMSLQRELHDLWSSAVEYAPAQ